MSYDAYKRKVLEDLDKQDFKAEAKDAIRRVLDSYFSQREGRIENILEVLEPSDDSCHQKWLDKTKEAAAAAHDTLGRSEHGKLWLAQISNNEHRFFFLLTMSQMPVQRDVMVRQTKALQKAEKEFEEKWKKIKESDKDIDDRAQNAAKEYGELLRKAAEEAAKVEKESRERLIDAISKAISGVKTVDTSGALTVIKLAVSSIGVLADKTKSRKFEIQALLSREKSIFITFKEARELVKEFLEETSYPKIKDAYDRAEEAAKNFVGKMSVDGLKDDAGNIASSATNELKNVFSKAEEAYKAFARKHENLFFGPLGGSYYQELMEGSFWKDQSSGWKDSKSDIDDILRDRYFDADEDEVLEVSLDKEGVSKEEKQRVYRELKGACQDLMKRWNQFKEINNEPEWALESRETLESIVDAMRSG